MGRAYSVNGYLNAVLRRSSKTLLVEGVTDKSAIQRLSVECLNGCAATGNIDHAGMFDDVAVSGLGNKLRILHLRSVAEAMKVQFPRISDVFGSLTDREWDGLCFTDSRLTDEWTPPVQRSAEFVTIGHSIENYHFDISCVVDYLKHSFSEHLSHQLIQALNARFPAAVVLAVGLSIVMKDLSGLSRSCGLIDFHHLRFVGGRYYIEASFGAACRARGINDSDLLVDKVNDAVNANWSGLSEANFTRWLPHGHLGSDALWACVAETAVSFGVSNQVGKQISQGFREERVRFCNDWLSRADPSIRCPLDDSIGWLHLPISE